MTTSTIKNLPKNTIELEVAIPWTEVKASYDKIFADISSTLEVPGFRKGKAPRKMVEGKIDKSKLYQEVLKDIVPKAYAEALKTHNLNPIASPKVDVLEAKENASWKFKATVAMKPKINLKSYKEKIRELKKAKATLPAQAGKIWLPGEPKDKKEEVKKPSMDEIVDVILKEVEIELPDILVEEEANKLLAGLLDETQKLGMTVEQYLAAKNTTTDQLRSQYANEARKSLTVELALAEIADKENITVTEDDIDKLIQKVEKVEEKERLKAQSYYLAHLIRQQKTLDFLFNL